MTKQARISRFAGSAMLLVAMGFLTACGGGSSPSIGAPPAAPTPTPTPTPVPTPTPTPTVTPGATGYPQVSVPSQFNTAEMRRSDGPAQHNAHVAWADGFSGSGVTIAVIDTGIDTDSPEFAGRISSASTDIYDTRDALDGPDDHGNNVALVAAAARDSTGILGMAWGADILAIRADEPGSCAGDNPQDSTTECGFLDSDIARGVDYAVANGAKIINISLGGAGGASAQLRQAVSNATNAGVLVVVAAGNDGFAELEDFGKELVGVGNGALIVVGAVDENFAISDFSNRAGTDTQFYIAARGETICCTYENGELFVDGEGFVYLISGTSFASPQVAGAAALLAQAFPNLTGQDIADILLRTAFDAGAAGDDAVFGRGILDINAAFQPLGMTSLAGSTNQILLGETGATASPAMGDALTTASFSAVVTDEFGRAFEAELGGNLRGAQQRNVLHGALAGQNRHLSAGSERASVAFTIDATGQGAPRSGWLALQTDEAEQARVLAARVALQLSPDTQFGFAYAQGADGLVAQLQGQDRPAFMIAGTSTGDAGLLQGSDVSAALRHSLGNWGLTVSAQSGETYAAASERRAAELRGRRAVQDIATMGIAADRRFGDVDMALGLSWMGEEQTMLGAHFQDGFGLAGADSMFLDMSGAWDFAADWRLGASVRQGWTRARTATFVAGTSQISARAFAIDVERRNLFARGDALALRVSQPLRVEGGHLDLLLPSAWDYETLTAQYSRHSLSLSPDGRELDAELAWRGYILGGNASASVFWRREPGHYRDAGDDTGVAVRWSSGF